MMTSAHEWRHALRTLRRAPGFTIGVALTLALGIGGNAAVFSALRTALLAGPPFPEADRLVAVDITVTDATHKADTYPWSYPKFETMRHAVELLDHVSVSTLRDVTLAGGTEPFQARLEAVTPDYLPMFGARAHVGRLLLSADDAEGSDGRAVVLTHDTWTRLFGADPSIVGRTIRVNGIALEVVGVADAAFRGVGGRSDLWVAPRALPALTNPRVLTRRWAHGFQAFARLKPGVTIDQATAEMAVVGRTVDAAHPDPDGPTSKWSATLVPIADASVDPRARTVIAVLAVAVALLLLLACVNVTNMLLVRVAARERELAVRAALGASRSGIMRQLAAESMLLASLGGVAGLLVAAWTVDLLRRTLPASWSSHGVRFLDPAQLKIDLMVVAFGAAITILTGLLIGMAPALRLSRPDLWHALRGSATAARGFGSLRKPSLRGALVIAQVALAVVLLAGTGLMVRTMAGLSRVDPGFRPEGVVAFRYGLAPSDPHASDVAFHQAILDRFRNLPGVTSAALTSCPPFEGCYDYNSVKQIDGQPPLPPSSQPMVRTHFVSDDYFRTLGIPVRAGRTFGSEDRNGAAPVIVVSEAAARALFGASPAEAIGRSLSESIELTKDDTMAEVIGVVGNVRHERLQEDPKPDVYISIRQSPYNAPAVMLRTTGELASTMAAARAALHDLAPDVPLHAVSTLPMLMSSVAARERFVAVSLGAFAALALVMAAVGVYGVVAYSVGQRRREVALRMVVGAAPGRVLALIVREGMTLVAAGALLGLAIALSLGEYLSSLLFGVAPHDPVTLVTIVALLLAIAAAATWIPARRAVRMGPMDALRSE
jgi:predicted permease